MQSDFEASVMLNDAEFSETVQLLSSHFSSRAVSVVSGGGCCSDPAMAVAVREIGAQNTTRKSSDLKALDEKKW